MKNKAIRFLIEFLNRRYPYLCREVVVGLDRHCHKNPRRKVKSLAQVEITTSDGLKPENAYDYSKSMPVIME